MQGRLQAIIAASTLMLLSLVMPPLIKPIVIIVSFATIALVTLRKGYLEGLTVLLSSTFAAAILGAFLVWQYQFAYLMLVSCLLMWLPVWVISVILREGRYLSLAIELTILMGVVGVVGFYLYATNPEPAAIWKNMFAPFMEMLPKDAPVVDIQEKLDFMAHYMTGVVAASTVFSLMFGLFLGRWWQSVLYNPGGFKKEFLSLTTEPRLAISTICVVILAWVSSGIVSEVAWNVLILVFVLYTYIGTAVLHSLFAAMNRANYIIPMFYVTLLLIPHVILPVAIVGLGDAWLNLRKINLNQT